MYIVLPNSSEATLLVPWDSLIAAMISIQKHSKGKRAWEKFCKGPDIMNVLLYTVIEFVNGMSYARHTIILDLHFYIFSVDAVD